jgi:hypothetical protein
MSLFRTVFFLSSVAFLCIRMTALASTDTITWGDENTRAGYQNNHNMNPAVVGSAQFGLLVKVQLPGNYQASPE